MQTYTWDELDERAQQNAINLYYHDSDYQSFIEEVQKRNADECPTVSDWAMDRVIRFTEHGERIA